MSNVANANPATAGNVIGSVLPSQQAKAVERTDAQTAQPDGSVAKPQEVIASQPKVEAPKESADPKVEAEKRPISGVQEIMKGADLTKAGTELNPGDSIRNVAPGNVIVESPEQALERASDAADDEAFGRTPLDDHPPLREGDVIQGPFDRKNRKPTDAELEYGKRVSNDGGFTPEELEQIRDAKPIIVDPPIVEDAPPDVPADPRKVAESRGVVFRDKE